MFDESGGTEQSRREESRKLIDIVMDVDPDKFSQSEIDFIHSMHNSLRTYGDKARITPKQLFWLRDIKDRCI